MNVKYGFKNYITLIIIVISLHILIDMLKPKFINCAKSYANKNRIHKSNSNKNIKENVERSDTVSAKNAYTHLGNLANTKEILLTESNGNMSTVSLKEIYDSIKWVYEYASTELGKVNTELGNKAPTGNYIKYDELKIFNRGGGLEDLYWGKEVSITNPRRKRDHEFYVCANGKPRPGCNAHNNGRDYGSCANCHDCIDTRHNYGAYIYC